MRKANIIITALFILGISTLVFGQAQHTENKADQTLRGSGRVNPSTLGMEFEVPLGNYAGRGINVPIGLSYSSKVWRLDSIGNFLIPSTAPSTSRCVNVNEARFAENSASGWTTTMQEAYIEYTGYDNWFNDRGFGISNNIGSCPESPNNGEASYVRRIQIHLPSGESHEFRMDDTPKFFATIIGWCTPNNAGNALCLNDPNLDANWNGWYYAADGSNMRYFEDRTNNVYVLQLPDGSRYDFNVNKTANANYNYKTTRTATKFTDRNGNFTTYHEPTEPFPNGYWTDTLGRSLSVPLPRKAPAAPVVQDYAMPGISGFYRFHWKKLKDTTAANSALTDFNQDLKYTASHSATPGTPNIQIRENTIFHSIWTEWVVDTFTVPDVPAIFNPVLLTAIEMPNGQMYRFSYDIRGEIEEVKYPTGGKESFIYDEVLPLTPAPSGSMGNQANRGVINRKVYQSETSQNPYITTYTNTAGNKITMVNPDLTKTERILHQGRFQVNGATNGDWGFDKALAGMAYEERSYSSTNKLISKKLTNWTITLTTVQAQYDTIITESNLRVTSEESIIYDENGNGISTTTTMEYEGDLNQKETPLLTKKSSQYKFVPVGSALPATPERTSETQYLQSDPNVSQSRKDIYKSLNMVGLATSSVVKDPSKPPGSDIVSRSEMIYDEANYSPSFWHGNPTTSRVWDSTKGNYDNINAYISTHAKFDGYGNLTESTDAKGNVTTTEYSSTYNYAFPTKVTTPIPSDGVSGSNTAFITTMAYDPTTGLPVSTTDANGLETRIEYDAVTLRPIRTKNYYQNSQVGGTSETVYNYVPNNYWVKSRTQIDADNWAESIAYSDGLGRTYKTEKVDTNGNIFSETEFDTAGRQKRTTNPYRANETKVWTTTNYDSQSRPFEVVTSDGAKAVTNYTLSVSGTTIGTVLTITDQALNKRRSITNALGQLIRTDEPNDAGSLGTLVNPTQPTFYSYDALNNLTSVVQGVQVRTFNFNSLSRLMSSNNPESGLIQFSYDDNGNLTSKNDARSITTNYTYDNLNRVIKKHYSDATPQVTYTYDNLTNSKAKLTKITTGIVSNPFSETRILGFDTLGQVTSSQQMTDGVTFNSMIYSYNLSGVLTEEVYPSGRIVKNTLDLNGKLAQVQSHKSNDTFKNYANAFTYTASGEASSLRLGNGKFESTIFNSRLQPIQIGLGSSSTSQNLLKLNFEYGSNPTENNGNVTKQIITTPTVGTNQGFIATQSYAYDSLNRIKQATETVVGQSNQGWQQTFVYDRYGNRTFDESNTNTLVKNCGTAPNKFVCSLDIPKFNPSANVGDNKLVGTSYDNVGNTKVDANGQVFTYDAENKQTKVVNAQGVTLGEYFYDGDGKRVKKYVPSTQETTIFVYDAGDKLVAEYSTVTASQSEAKIYYTTNDHLGSPRIITDTYGQVVSRRDFMPFGEEIARANYGTDNVRQKFTGYERDTETNLDYAKARMFGSSLGRFTSPDPLMESAVKFMPQSWNRYTYVLNNPLKYTDPSGMIWGERQGKNGETQYCYAKGNAVCKGYTAYTGDGILENPRVGGKELGYAIRLLPGGGWERVVAIDLKDGGGSTWVSQKDVIAINAISGGAICSLTGGIFCPKTMDDKIAGKVQVAADAVQYAFLIKTLLASGVVSIATIAKVVRKDPKELVKLATEVVKDFGNLKCQECAQALLKEFEKAGYKGVIRELRSTEGFDVIVQAGQKTGEAISTNGSHYGVQVGNRVYDLLNPKGISIGSWAKAYESRGAVVLVPK
jgi:RHS repeat-associated protein